MGLIDKILGRMHFEFEDGKIYEKGLFGRNIEISEEEYKAKHQRMEITKLSATFSKPNLVQLNDNVKNLIEKQESPLGERAIAKIIKQDVTKGVVDGRNVVSFTASIQIETESGRKSDRIDIGMEEMYGPLVDAGVDMVELYRILYQLNYSGYSATKEDIQIYVDLMNKAKKNK